MLALIRSLSVLALFSFYGTLIFRVFVAGHAYARMPVDLAAGINRFLRLLVWGSLAVDAVALIGWLTIEAGVMADAHGMYALIQAIWPVTTETAFGRLIVLQLGMTILIVISLGRGTSLLRWRLTAGVATISVLLQAGHSHALAMDGAISLLIVSDCVHLLSAGAWLGGLVPLLWFVGRAPYHAAATAARHFSPLGKLCLYGLVASAAYQGWRLLGGVSGMLGTAYGWMAMVKVCLFLALFGMAVANRYRFAPALLGDRAVSARRSLITSIAIQTGFGVAVVIAAGLLASMPPGLHSQPLWPFRYQLSVVTLQEDADFRLEAVCAVLALGLAMSLAALGIAVRRLRWPVILAGILIVCLATPHLDLLVVEAYPTSFYRSPTSFSAATIAEGAALYPSHCASCHGAAGRGDGPAAEGLLEPPTDLTSDGLWSHTDGALFWWLSHGIDAPNGGLAMPGFADVLSADQRWALIDFIRAHNAGETQAITGDWSPPLRAPMFTASCAGGRRLALADLRGGLVRVAFADGPALAPLPGGEVQTILISPASADVPPSGDLCVATDPVITAAYRIVSGRSSESMRGTQFLIDANGWLRSMWRDGGSAAMLTEIQRIERHPFADQAVTPAHHHGS